MFIKEIRKIKKDIIVCDFGVGLFKDQLLKFINKLEKMYKSNKITHSRNSQITNVMTQRLRVINPKDKRLMLSKKYFDFLKSRTKIKNEKDRKKLNIYL